MSRSIVGAKHEPLSILANDIVVTIKIPITAEGMAGICIGRDVIELPRIDGEEWPRYKTGARWIDIDGRRFAIDEDA